MASIPALICTAHVVITLATISARVISSNIPMNFQLYNKTIEQTEEIIHKQNALPFPVMDIYMPKENNFRTGKLLRKLGGTMDNNWMSIELPESIDNIVMGQNEIEATAVRDKEIEQVQTFVRTTTDITMFNNKSLSDMTMFMVKLSTCKIRYEWEDLGVLFWPRYVKSGTCQAGATCSWPPGMNCSPGKPKKLHILRWRCRTRKSEKKRAYRMYEDNRKKRPTSNSNSKENRDRTAKDTKRRRKRNNRGRKQEIDRHHRGRRRQRERINKSSNRLSTMSRKNNHIHRNRKHVTHLGHSNVVRKQFTCKWQRVPHYVNDSCACSCSSP